MQHPVRAPERRRLIDKLLREVGRAEAQAIEHAPREIKRVGHTPPTAALFDVARHAATMRPRFEEMMRAHDLPHGRARIRATLSNLRHLVVDRLADAERAYRSALLDLRHGMDVVKLLREAARRETLFGIIRWSDDWLGERRTLVARVEANLGWFAEQARGVAPTPVTEPLGDELLDDWDLFDEPAPPTPRKPRLELK